MRLARNPFIGLPLAAALTLVLVACEEGPTGLVADYDEVTEVVFTHGFPALANHTLLPIAFSNLVAPALVEGSETTPLSLNGEGCSEFPSAQITITYTVTGPQGATEFFTVYSTWTYDGTGFVGSNPVTREVASGNFLKTFDIPMTVVNGTTGGEGETSFSFGPHAVTSNGSPPLNVHTGQSQVTMHVAFNTCTVPNTPPTLTLPNSRTLEATTAQGTVTRFRVTATDAEDGDLTDAVTCSHESGSRFPIGATEIECSVEDSGGLTAEASFFIYVEDSTAPTFVAFPGNQTLVATNSAGVVLELDDFNIVARDWGPRGEQGGEISPPVSIDCTVPADGDAEADGYVVAIGQKVTVSCVATDSGWFRAPPFEGTTENSSAPHTFDVYVTLDLSDHCGYGEGEDGRFGLDSPLRIAGAPSAHRANSTIPHKVCAPRYADGTVATDLGEGLKLHVTHQGASQIGGNDALEIAATGSTAWRFEDKETQYYIFNAKTDRSMKTGIWQTEASYMGVVVARTLFELR